MMISLGLPTSHEKAASVIVSHTNKIGHTACQRAITLKLTTELLAGVNGGNDDGDILLSAVCCVSIDTSQDGC